MIRHRLSSFCWLLTVCLTVGLLAGCATGSPSWWKKPNWSIGHRSERREQTANLTASTEPTPGNVSAETPNPFQPPAKNDSDRPQAVATTDQNMAGLPQRFDATTMMLIESEFKDATLAEREQWFEELRQVPPEMVPRILRMRRLTLQATEQTRPAPSKTEAVSSISQSHETRQGANLPHRPDNPLDAVVPWQPETVTSNSPLPISSTEARQQPITMTSRVNSGEANLTTTTVSSTSPTDNEQEYQATLDQLISLTEQNLSQSPAGNREEDRLNYIADHTHLRMLYLMAERQERALEAIPDLPTVEQEFWQQMFWAMSSYFDGNGIPNSADRATHTVSQLTEATSRLREKANLELRNLSFCQKIDGFGVYDRFERDEFRPGQPVLLYAEMRNFLSEPTSDGLYKTVLKSTIEIHRSGSQPGLVTRQEFPPTKDICRNRRLDYFHSYMINIPDRVTVGPHLLKLIVEDQINHKVASYTINFMVQ